jgi:uncharacterized protein (TIGR00255 family)
MINSMTAFARETGDLPGGSVTIEIRSVNHRYLDCSFKLPEPFRALEPLWREHLQTALTRGKIECAVRWQEGGQRASGLGIDTQCLGQLVDALAQLESKLPGCTPPNALEVLQWPGVLSSGPIDTDARAHQATGLFSRALQTLGENRAREGLRLAEFISERIAAVSAEVQTTRKLVPQILSAQRQRIQRRLQELCSLEPRLQEPRLQEPRLQEPRAEVDPARLEQELVFMAQKADVDEELDRLQAHVEEVTRVLAKGGPCGRRLDFLMQELNREANTLSSKSQAISTTANAVELKVLIEQMREQIQNLE